MSGSQAGHGQESAEPPATSQRWGRIWASRTLLLRVARRRCANAEDAEDAVQEAMLRAAKHPEIADDRLQAWLIAVTTRLCIDGYRRRASEAGRWARAAAQPVVEQFGQYPEEEACDRSEAVWVASKTAELLPHRQAEAIHLVAAGCDVQAVAHELGVNYRAAESLLARARRTLRAALATGLGAVAWAWRTPATAVSNSGPVALASGALAVVVITVPIALSPLELLDGLWPPATPGPDPHGTSLIGPQTPAAPPATQGPGGAHGTPQHVPPASVPGPGHPGDLSPQQPNPPLGGSTPAQPAPPLLDGQPNQLNPPPLAPPPNLPPPPDASLPATPPLNLPPPPTDVPPPTAPPNLPPPPDAPLPTTPPPNLPPPPTDAPLPTPPPQPSLPNVST